MLVPMAAAAIIEVGHGLSLFYCYENAVILGTGSKKWDSLASYFLKIPKLT